MPSHLGSVWLSQLWLVLFSRSWWWKNDKKKQPANVGCFKSLLSIKVVWICFNFSNSFCMCTKAQIGWKTKFVDSKHLLRNNFRCCFFSLSRLFSKKKCILIWILFPAGIFVQKLKTRNILKTFPKGEKTTTESKAGKKIHTKWNKLLEFYLSIWPKSLLLSILSHLWVRFRFVSLARTQFFTFSTSVMQSDAMFQPFFFSLSIVRLLLPFLTLNPVHSDEQHFYSNSFRKTRHSDGVKRTGTFRNSPEKSTHMQIFSIAPEI